MSAFFNYFYELVVYIVGHILNGLVNLFTNFIMIFNFKYYSRLLRTYKEDFGVWGWVFAAIAYVLIFIVVLMLVFLLYRLIKIILTFKRPIKENEELKDEITKLNHQMMKLSYERDKILAMQVSNLGLAVNKDLLPVEEETQEDIVDMRENDSDTVEEENEDSEDTIQEEDIERRFNRLTAIDRYYMSGSYTAPEYNDDITLEDICKDFRNFAASKLGLYYELDLIKFFVAA